MKGAAQEEVKKSTEVVKTKSESKTRSKSQKVKDAPPAQKLAPKKSSVSRGKKEEPKKEEQEENPVDAVMREMMKANNKAYPSPSKADAPAPQQPQQPQQAQKHAEPK